MMHLNRTAKRTKPPKSGHQNILAASGGKWFVRLGSIDYTRRYETEEIPQAVEFRNMMRKRLGWPEADF